MERDRQLDHAEPRAQMPARNRYGGYGFLPKLVGELGKLVLGERADIAGKADRIQQGRLGPI
jgi:hypothetical protein